jgi:hypothetical protein
MSDIISASAAMAPLVIAQAASSQPEQPAVWWILGLAGVAVVFNQIAQSWKTITNRFKEREQPGPHVATIEDCEKRHQTLDNHLSEMERQVVNRGEKLREETLARAEKLREEVLTRAEVLRKETEAATNAIRLELKADIGGVHDRVSDILEAVSEIAGKVNK